MYSVCMLFCQLFLFLFSCPVIFFYFLMTPLQLECFSSLLWCGGALTVVRRSWSHSEPMMKATSLPSTNQPRDSSGQRVRKWRTSSRCSGHSPDTEMNAEEDTQLNQCWGQRKGAKYFWLVLFVSDDFCTLFLPRKAKMFQCLKAVFGFKSAHVNILGKSCILILECIQNVKNSRNSIMKGKKNVDFPCLHVQHEC